MDPGKPKGYVSRSFNWENPIVSPDEASRFDKLKQNNTEVLSSPLELFLDLSAYSPRNRYEAREIRASCSEHIADLQTGGEGAPRSLAVWMDDRGKLGGARSYNGPMKVKDWLERLKLKRFDQEGYPNAETRRIYIPNPDAWTLGTLILKANKGQVPVLRNCIRRHLDGEASIKARFPGRFFVLEFHLPFIAWRGQASEDGRKKADKSPLRSCRSLSFLSGSHESAAEMNHNAHVHLHDAQVSCVVTGFNTTTWTAWVMADTYFHDVDDSQNNRDMLEYYYDADAIADPLTRGELMVDPPLWDPREYFLRILKTRLAQIEDEWRNITYMVKANVKIYLQDSHINVPPMRFSLGSVDEKVQAVRNSYGWVRELKSVVAYLINAIATTIAAINSFEKQEMFHYPEDKGNLNALLYDVLESFGELREVEGTLQNINRSVDDFKQQLDLYLQVEGSYALANQQWNITLLHFLGPPTLATGIIQSEVVQLQPPIVCFLVLTAAIAAITVAVRPVLTSVASSWRPQRNTTQKLENVHRGYTRDDIPVSERNMQGSGPSIRKPLPAFIRLTSSGSGWNSAV